MIQKFEEGRDSDGGKKAKADSSEEDRRQINDQITERTGERQGAVLEYQPGLSAWLRIVFAALIGVTVLNGISGIIISHFDKPVWSHHRIVTGIVLSVTGAAVFMMTRQPYAGILYLAMLVVKGLLIGKGKGLS